MRAALATIPGATGALEAQGGVLPQCVAVSRARVNEDGNLVAAGANVTGAEIEIGAAVRELHEELNRLDS